MEFIIEYVTIGLTIVLLIYFLQYFLNWDNAHRRMKGYWLLLLKDFYTLQKHHFTFFALIVFAPLYEIHFIPYLYGSVVVLLLFYYRKKILRVFVVWDALNLGKGFVFTIVTTVIASLLAFVISFKELVPILLTTMVLLYVVFMITKMIIAPISFLNIWYQKRVQLFRLMRKSRNVFIIILDEEESSILATLVELAEREKNIFLPTKIIDNKDAFEKVVNQAVWLKANTWIWCFTKRVVTLAQEIVNMQKDSIWIDLCKEPDRNTIEEMFKRKRTVYYYNNMEWDTAKYKVGYFHGGYVFPERDIKTKNHSKQKTLQVFIEQILQEST